jgi:quercetin 2,3-dioxygenase
MQKKILKSYRNDLIVDNGQLQLYRLIPTAKVESLGPFVFVDYYSASGGRGIGQDPHPHAGIEVLSYLFQGYVQHRDSRGFVDRIAAGDAQYIKAGRGILHAETHLNPMRKGIQLWLSLPPDRQLDEPTYAAYRAANFPVIKVGNNQIKIIAGNLNDIEGPVVTVSKTFLFHIELRDKNEVTLEVDEAIELGALVINGQASFSGKIVSPGDLAIFGDGNEIALKAEGDAFPVDVVILGGIKINYPLVFHGPFVMDSMEKIKSAYENYKNGSMGKLI